MKKAKIEKLKTYPDVDAISVSDLINKVNEIIDVINKYMEETDNGKTDEP